MNKFYPKNILPESEVKKFLIFFYIVGVLGFIIPYSKTIFIIITPLALLLNAYILAIYHSKYKKGDVIIFIIIFSLGFFIEVIGVNTGIIFGNYSYGSALGFKLFNTPILVGLNWLFLTYTVNSFSEIISDIKGLQIIIAPSLMLAYDFILEQIAPKIDMWIWKSNQVPFKNYIAWWIIGFIFTVIIKMSKTNTKNPMAILLFVCQFLFFVVLFFLINLFND